LAHEEEPSSFFFFFFFCSSLKLFTNDARARPPLISRISLTFKPLHGHDHVGDGLETARLAGSGGGSGRRGAGRGAGFRRV
jgi:hypothetical protein